MIFVAQNKQLQQLKPQPKDDVMLKLKDWTVQQLRTWLGLRGVRSGDSLKEDLVRIAYFTWKLGLPVNPDEVSTQREAAARLSEVLTVKNRLLNDPTTVNNWSTDLKELPTIEFGNIFNYLINTPGKYIF